MEKKKFERLQKLAAKKAPVKKKLSLEEGRKYAHKLIDEWANEK